MDQAIETNGLTKRYGSATVLRDVDLRVPVGSLYGFLGPNGAGKTTTIRIILGLLKASAGAARIFGLDSWKDGPALRQSVGYLPGDVRFYDRWTGRRTLNYFDAVRGGGHESEIARLIEAFDFDPDRRVRHYSRGNKQKLGLVQAMLHRPQLLILDEPTTGLDPLVQESLYTELRRAAREGRTVLFSSHTLAEVEALCDHVAIVREGTLIEQESIDVLRKRALRHVEIHFHRPASEISVPDAFRVTHAEDKTLGGSWAGECGPLLQWLASQPVQDVSIAPPDLEDLFMTYYDRARNNGAGGGVETAPETGGRAVQEPAE